MRQRAMYFVSRLVAMGFLAAMLCPVLVAEDYYVNNVVGDDNNNGRNILDSSARSGPLRSISRALLLARGGDTIIVQKTDVPYNECLTIQGVRHSGTTHSPLKIVSDGAILDGTISIAPEAWERYRGETFRFMPELKSHQQLYLDGKPARRIVSEHKSFVPDLKPGQWTLVEGWIYFCSGKNNIPGDFDLRCCSHQTGITLYEVENVLIDGLIIQGFQLDGVNAHDAVDDCVVTNCKLRGNGRSGISVGGVSRVTLDLTVAGANGAAQIRSEGYCSLKVVDCRLLESEAAGPAIVRDGGQIAIDGKDYR